MVDDELSADERRDHAKAVKRGERLLALTDALVSELFARALISDQESTQLVVFHKLADDLYGNAAIDVPTLRTHVIPNDQVGLQSDVPRASCGEHVWPEQAAKPGQPPTCADCAEGNDL